ncbi:UDP-N-acetylmuramoyl-tripeptide--D-alanyl-D-alanine ligase [Paenibacillus sp. GYB003]|uniref:UDP-N-acetylmuramoyl-tripeptide--D-alanyl-D- alanine ligase n=1 Tax=Paenibacillus sp. GYB003 TaxID=2994392 RepID=UPI002F967803
MEAIVGGKAAADRFVETAVRGVSIDSRTIREGNLFVPLVRVKDGHDFVGEAVAGGAAAVLWQADRPDPPANVPVIRVGDCLEALQRLAADYRNGLPVKAVGVTGSNGKTTTKDMIDSIFGTTYKVHKTQGNWNSQIGTPLTLLDIAPDTEYAVVEMGMSEPGQIERLSRMVRPDIAVITMIGVSHLSTLGSREAIAAAKMEIVRGLEPGGTLVYNGDEPLLEREIRLCGEPARSVTFGFSDGADYRAEAVRTDASGVSFRLSGTTYRIPLLGKHNVTNALAAIAAAEVAGIALERVKEGLERANVTGMRMELLRSADGYAVINDAWNASPVSVLAALDTFGELAGYDRKIAVLGDMRELGPEELRYHADVGRALNPDAIPYVFTIGELAERIALEAASRYPAGRVKHFRDQAEALREIRAKLGPGDAVLVKGSRGLELERLAAELLKERD